MYVETRYLYEVTFNNLHAICKITDVDHGLLYYYDSNNNLRPAIYSKLQNAFNALISTHFFTESGVSVDVNTDKTRVEMLRDYALGTNEEEDTTFKANTKAILTTADKNAHDGYSYVGVGTIATISRGYDGASLITVKGDLRLGNIILDGDSSHHTANTNGGILNVSSSGKLTVGSGTMIQNSTTSGSGAGVYLAEGSMMYISGGPVFANNLATVTLAAGSTNGNENYTDAKQDVFIAGYSSGDAQSLIVTGNISLSPGSIWVWAENQRHYEQSKQFAIMQNGTNYSGLSAFRNARTDAETKNPLNDNPLYLYGVKRGTDGKVYWSGSMDLTVTKIVTGDFADHSRSFAFEVSGLTAGDSYTLTHLVLNGNNWSEDTGAGATESKSADQNGKISFTQTHGQGVRISIPAGTTVTVSEGNAQDVVEQ